MDQSPGVDFDALHASIVAAIAEAFPVLRTVEAYREEVERTELTLPACLIELVDLEATPEEDPGTEQLAMMARFDARIIMGFRTQNAKIEVRKLAAALAHFIRNKRWGQRVGAAEVLGAFPDEFDPELDQFEVFRVEWRQIVRVGANVWSGDDWVREDGTPIGTPNGVVYSWVPRVGQPFRGEYRPLDGAPVIPE